MEFGILHHQYPLHVPTTYSKGLAIDNRPVGIISQVLINEDLTNPFSQSHVFAFGLGKQASIL